MEEDGSPSEATRDRTGGSRWGPEAEAYALWPGSGGSGVLQPSAAGPPGSRSPEGTPTLPLLAHLSIQRLKALPGGDVLPPPLPRPRSWELMNLRTWAGLGFGPALALTLAQGGWVS